MSNLDNPDLECDHVTEDRKKYDVSINDKNKTLTLCNICFDKFKNFTVIKFLSKILENVK